MNPLTALCFLGAGGTLWLMAPPPRHTSFARGIAVAVALIGLIRLAGYLFGTNVGLDDLLFRHQVDALAVPNRMAPNTALCFLLAGTGLFTLDRPPINGTRPSFVVSLPMVLLAYLAIVGYAYGAGIFYRVSQFIPMALNTAVGFLLLGAGIITARPQSGVPAIVLGDTEVGRASRRLIAAGLGATALLGWLALWSAHRNWLDLDSAVSFLAVLTGVAFAGLAAWNAVLARRAAVTAEHAEGAVRESEERLFRILDAMPVGVFVVDAQGRPYFANERAQELLGKGIVAAGGGEQSPGVFQAYVAGTDQLYPGDEQPIVRALGGERSYKDDFEIRRPDRVFPIEVWASPVHGADGRLVSAIAAFNDITRRRRDEAVIADLNERLQRQVDDLAAVNKELETFSYSVSHDLRAPLRAVDGFSRILVEDHGPALDDEGRRLLGVVRESADRMGRLIDDLLRFSHLSRKELAWAEVDMCALAREAAEELRAGGAYADAAVNLADLPPAVGDANLLRQVWINLIGNALKYSGKHAAPVVEVGCDRTKRAAAYYVRDNGVGFDMKHADKLFAVFQRLHREDEFEGTGVGLPIVQRIVHRHGGRIWAESAPGRGATFYFTVSVGDVA